MAVKALNSFQRSLLAAELECSFWSLAAAGEDGRADMMSELVILENDIRDGRFPWSGRAAVRALQLELPFPTG